MLTSEQIINTVCGSMALEGLTVPEDVREIGRQYLNGSIKFDDAVSMIISRYQLSNEF